MTVESNTDRIVKTVDIRAGIDRVWRALTDHEEFGSWFQVKLDGPFIVGTRSTGHITYPGFEHEPWESFIKETKAPSYFAFTWHPYAVDHSIDYSKEPPTLVEFKLEPIEAGTRLTVIESGFDALPAERRPLALRMNEGGWEEQVGNIKRHAENGR
ncbi:SRPBCC family protein [Brucella intermedia]|uniref:SRPBCC family protein n=1 Tax=Brucella intermedia TaxID=94625 RepID=UPI00235EE099|nr:SRPBCC family protein [Brucella intermedia]